MTTIESAASLDALEAEAGDEARREQGDPAVARRAEVAPIGVVHAEQARPLAVPVGHAEGAAAAPAVGSSTSSSYGTVARPAR